jgi:hypothetical protein
MVFTATTVELGVKAHTINQMARIAAPTPTTNLKTVSESTPDRSSSSGS